MGGQSPADAADEPLPPAQAEQNPADSGTPGEYASGTAAESLVASEAPQVEQDDSRIERLMREAEADLQALRLTRPPGDSAHDRYREVLALEPGHAGALAGIDAIVARYAAMAEKAFAEGERELAALYLRRGRQVQPGHPALAAAEQTFTEPAPVAVAAPTEAAETEAEPAEESIRGPGTGNIVKDFQKLWRSVFD